MARRYRSPLKWGEGLSSGELFRGSRFARHNHNEGRGGERGNSNRTLWGGRPGENFETTKTELIGKNVGRNPVACDDHTYLKGGEKSAGKLYLVKA